jgi:hypothetical protein
MMNLEFMSCILYGLKEIYYTKRARKVHTTVLHNMNTNLSSQLNIEEKDKFLKGPKAFKKHNISYQKLFSEEEIGITAKEKEKVKETQKKFILEELDPTKSLSVTEQSSSIYQSFLDDSSKQSKYDAVITEHCPQLFNDIRNEDSLEYAELLVSLDPLSNKQAMIKIKESAGKSGSFFFFSYDKKFIIKTVKEHELETMLGQFMESYYNHAMNNPETLLTKIYGLYTVEIK